MAIFRSLALISVYCLGLIAAQTVTVTVNTCSATTVTTTVTATPLTSCQAGYQPISNPNFETVPLSPTWTNDMGLTSVASCGQQGTVAAPGKCAALKGVGTREATITQTLSNLCPGKTYQISFYIGIPKAAFSLSTGTRLPTFKFKFNGQAVGREIEPVCGSSVGIGTNPCTLTDVYGTHSFRKITLPVTPAVAGTIGSISITVGDTLIVNQPVVIDSISVTAL